MTYKVKKITILTVTELLVILILLLIFFGDKVFYDLAKIYNNKFSDKSDLGKDTFLFMILERDESNIENINSLFLIDICDNENKNIQVIFIPVDLKVAVPEISQERIGELYPFGGGKLIAEAISDQLDLNIDYYIIIDAKYLKDLLDKAAPVNVDLKKDINIGNSLFEKGSNNLDSAKLETFLSMNIDEHDWQRLQANKLYVMKEIINSMKQKKIDLLTATGSNELKTNIENTFLIKNRLYYFGEALFNFKRKLLITDETQYGESMEGKSDYLDFINSIIMDTETSIYYTYLNGTYEETDENSYFVLTEKAKSNTIKIIKNNSYSSLDFKNESDFNEIDNEELNEDVLSPEDKKEEKIIVEKEKEDIVATEETAERQKIKIKVLNGGNKENFQSALEQIEMLGYLEENLIIDEVRKNLIYGDSLIYYKMGMEEYAAEIGSSLDIKEAFINTSEDEPGYSDILIIVGIDYKGEKV